MSSFPQEQSLPREAEGESRQLSTGLLGKVFFLLAFSIAFAAVGGYVGYQLGPGWFWPIFIAQIALIFAVQAFREREPLNMILLYAFTFTSGAMLGPLIAEYFEAGVGEIVIQAAVITGVMTAGLAGFALVTKRNLMALAPFMFVALLGLLAAMIVNIFVGGSFVYGLISWAGAIIFSILLAIDVQRAKYAPDTMGNAVVITLGIYLDIVNLFMFILRILGGRR